MLEPQVRVLLLDVLRPPIGHSLDFAVGTTFSLNLTALLAVPLSLTLLDQADRYGRIVADKVTALEAIRRSTSRFVVFCQEGEVLVPPPNRRLLTLLESSIVQVTPPGAGVFHPKVWLLRFIAPDLSVVYRLVCATRNLTFDRCWDTALVLEGMLVDRKNGFAANRPLSDFFGTLPGMARHPMQPGHAAKLRQLIEECRRVDFAPPDGFDEFRFWPLGISTRRVWPFEGRIDRMVVVAPFVSEGCIQRLRSVASDLMLVSRTDSLESIDRQVLATLSQVKVFGDEQPDVAEDLSSADRVVDQSPVEELQESGATPSLTGLHAKLYVVDSGAQGRLWTGSANATDSAFHHNIEFLVELVGKKRLCGCDALLAVGSGETRFAHFLQDFPPGRVEDVSDDRRALDLQLREVVRAVCKAGFRMELSSNETGSWSTSVFLDHPEFVSSLNNAYIRISPASLDVETRGCAIALPATVELPVATFGNLDFDTLTAFLSVQIDVTDSIRWRAKRFTLLVPAIGMPPDRAEKMLLAAIGSRPAFETYLRMMLSDLRQDALSLECLSSFSSELSSHGAAQYRGDTESPLFELLVRALARDPERIDDIAHTIAELRQSANSEIAIPPGFTVIWEVILSARKSLVHEVRAATI